MVEPSKLFGRLGNTMFQHAYVYAQARKGLVPDVYVQGIEYFAPYQDEIRALYSEGLNPIDQVSIHVRRGDYVGNKFYVDLFDSGYYERAMSEFPGEKFLVFSDDIEWCQSQPLFADCSFSVGNDEITDMNLMAGCRGHIVANSSFSWWAAFLSKNKTVAPKEWFSDKVQRVSLPEEWIKV